VLAALELGPVCAGRRGDQCAFEPGSDDPEMLALYLGMLDADFTIVDSPELADALRKLTRRYQRAINSSQEPG
jgi:hypothetical protein